MSDRHHLEIALKQINFARECTLSLLEDVGEDEWFMMPEPGVTHVAWQVAHLAVAEYGLCLFRLRGRHADDVKLMPSPFRKKYSKGTEPDPDPSQNSSPAEIRQVFDSIHERVQTELAEVTDADLTGEIDRPYSVEATQLGGLYFCAAHEMMHAGQIGLIRRLLGKKPIR